MIKPRTFPGKRGQRLAQLKAKPIFRFYLKSEMRNNLQLNFTRVCKTVSTLVGQTRPPEKFCGPSLAESIKHKEGSGAADTGILQRSVLTENTKFLSAYPRTQVGPEEPTSRLRIQAAEPVQSVLFNLKQHKKPKLFRESSINNF